ncbi:MAG: hypothetical protein Q8Q14_04740 [Gemmatimonadales bacterium]|nr:hypothetical protein [Gemmatimonadales bacterium]
MRRVTPGEVEALRVSDATGETFGEWLRRRGWERKEVDDER